MPAGLPKAENKNSKEWQKEKGDEPQRRRRDQPGNRKPRITPDPGLRLLDRDRRTIADQSARRQNFAPRRERFNRRHGSDHPPETLCQ